MLYVFLPDGGEVLRWCQGEVLAVSNVANLIKPGKFKACFKEGEAVKFKWDPIVDRHEVSYISTQRLLPSKWNPKKSILNGHGG